MELHCVVFKFTSFSCDLFGLLTCLWLQCCCCFIFILQMEPKVTAASKRQRGGAGTSRAREFNQIKFLGRFLAEKPFGFNHHGKYRGLAQIIDERGWGKLVDPISRVNYDVVHKFYANAVLREGEPFTFESYVRGKMVQFDRDAINELLGKPSNLETTELD